MKNVNVMLSKNTASNIKKIVSYEMHVFKYCKYAHTLVLLSP